LAIDPRKLRPSVVCRLLNSTPLGEVIGERQLLRHRNRAGLRITSTDDADRIDLLRYAAWLVIERHRPQPSVDEAAAYEAQKERARQRNLAISKSGRDIGELPAVVDPERKARATRDFRFFCEQYFPQTFNLTWSEDHYKVIAVIEAVVLEGGQFAIALPRGGGKTVLCEVAALWAMLYGHRRFIAIIGPDESHAMDRVSNLHTELEHNDLLCDDFPAVCIPIRKLEGIHQRRLLYRGESIHLEFTSKRIILPNMPDSPAAGAIVATAGITGQIRGMNYKLRDGTSLRPSLCIVDDPQTRESAHSPSQCAQREKIINGDILGLAGPGARMAVLLPCTVIQPDDLAERVLDREKNPQWHGQRTKMVYAWPTNERLWLEYAALRRDTQRNCAGRLSAITEACNAFYATHRVAMDAGAIVAWPQRHGEDELSALQNSMNLKLDRGEAAFWAEYQNEPLPEEQVDDGLLTADQIAAKVNGMKRGEVPIGCSHLTMFIDVQGKALFWLVTAWEDSFTGYVIDYGTEPDQRSGYFTLREIRRTLADAAPRAGQEGSIYAGLERLIEAMLPREWPRDDGTMVRIDRCLIDANWGSSTDIVYQFCRQSRFANIVMPSHGRYVGASSVPFSEFPPRPGERRGLNWLIRAGKNRQVRHVTFDTNYWKSFVHARLAVPMGDPGCLSLFGRAAGRGPRCRDTRQKPRANALNVDVETGSNRRRSMKSDAYHDRHGESPHQMLADHLISEYRVKTEGRGRTVDEWKLRADGADNHWLDCLVGCAVAASMQGAILFGTDVKPTPRRKIKLSDIQKSRWYERVT